MPSIFDQVLRDVWVEDRREALGVEQVEQAKGEAEAGAAQTDTRRTHV
jgi:hypothetical protein